MAAVVGENGDCRGIVLVMLVSVFGQIKSLCRGKCGDVCREETRTNW